MRGLCVRLLVFVSAFISSLLIPMILMAQDSPCPPMTLNLEQNAPQQEWWMVLLEFAVQLSVPILTAVLGVLGAWVVRKLTKKWDSEKQEAALRLTDNLIGAGIAFAEEQARKVLRVEAKQTESAEKLQAAIDFVQRQLDQSGVARVAEEKLVELIEAKLHQERTKPDGIVPSDVAPVKAGDKPSKIPPLILEDEEDDEPTKP